MEAKGKIALITGGSRGLGKSMAIHLAGKGNDIILTYHSQKEMADGVVKEIEAMGRKAASIQYNASDFTSLDPFLQQVKEILKSKWGSSSFDILINNAGIGATIPYAEVKVENFDTFLNIHFKSVFFLTQRALSLLNDGGCIINISTGTTRFCVPGYSVYASMKGAIEVFTRYLAKEVGARGITANVIAPGPIETDFNNAAIRNNPERKKMLAAQSALGRVGEADDIGGVVSLLCSEESKWITGQRIEVSGGINL